MAKFTLKDLTLESISHWVIELTYWRIIIFLILLLVFDYCFFIKPNFEHYSRQQVKETNLKLEFEEKQQNVATLSDRRKQLAELSKQYKNLLKQFSTRQRISTLLEEISKAGAANGLIFEFFAPLPQVTRDFYFELPIKMTVRGHYEQLALFLNQIAQWNQIVTIDDFELWPSSSKKGEVNEEVLLMKMIAKIYCPL